MWEVKIVSKELLSYLCAHLQLVNRGVGEGAWSKFRFTHFIEIDSTCEPYLILLGSHSFLSMKNTSEI